METIFPGAAFMLLLYFPARKLLHDDDVDVDGAGKRRARKLNPRLSWIIVCFADNLDLIKRNDRELIFQSIHISTSVGPVTISLYSWLRSSEIESTIFGTTATFTTSFETVDGVGGCFFFFFTSSIGSVGIYIETFGPLHRRRRHVIFYTTYLIGSHATKDATNKWCRRSSLQAIQATA